MGIHRMTQGFYCKEEQISGAAAGRASWVKHIANLKKKKMDTEAKGNSTDLRNKELPFEYTASGQP